MVKTQYIQLTLSSEFTALIPQAMIYIKHIFLTSISSEIKAGLHYADYYGIIFSGLKQGKLPGWPFNDMIWLRSPFFINPGCKSSQQLAFGFLDMFLGK